MPICDTDDRMNNKDVEMIAINVFHIFKKNEEILYMLSRHIGDKRTI